MSLPWIVLAGTREGVCVRPMEVSEGQGGGALVAPRTRVVQGAVRPEAADDQGDPGGDAVRGGGGGGGVTTHLSTMTVRLMAMATRMSTWSTLSMCLR